MKTWCDEVWLKKAASTEKRPGQVEPEGDGASRSGNEGPSTGKGRQVSSDDHLPE
jgi:hypothetical protein